MMTKSVIYGIMGGSVTMSIIQTNIEKKIESNSNAM